MVIAQAKPIAKNISPESEASDRKGDRLEQTIYLQSLNLELPMHEVYRRVKF